MKVGIIGCGFIGSEVAKFLDKDYNFKLVAINDINKAKADSLIKKLKNKPKNMSINELIRNSDLVVEAASKEAVGEILRNKNIDKKGKNFLIMSSGGLIKYQGLLRKIKNCSITIPSGAIAGLDAIKAVSQQISSLQLTTTKPIEALQTAPYIYKNKINLKKIKGKRLLFKGKLKDAIKGFPQNINVAATLLLASKFKNIKIKIIADSNSRFNMHEIKAIGKFGTITTITKNLPSKNPRTSYLAVLSAIEKIKSLKSTTKIGN